MAAMAKSSKASVWEKMYFLLSSRSIEGLAFRLHAEGRSVQWMLS